MHNQVISASEITCMMKSKGDIASKREVVSVSGVVVRTGPDMYGQPSVELSDKVEGNPLILCVTSRVNQNKMKIGENVIVSGDCLGYTHGYVVIKQCVFRFI